MAVDAARQVTVLVVTYNSADVIEGCLRSLPAAFADTAAPHVVVVDNASTDGTPELVARVAPDAQVLRRPANRGYAAAINAGMAAASGGIGDALLILNPDIRLDEGSVEPLLAALGEPGVGIAVPKLVDEQGRLLRSLRHRPSAPRVLAEAVLGGDRAAERGLGEVVGDPAAYERPGTADWATGAAMAVTAACAAAVGPWDESYFLYSEEVDFALRAGDAGFGLRYEPAARAVHLGGESGTDERLWTLLVTNRVKLHRRRHGRARGAAFGAAVLLNESVRAARGSRTSRAAVRGLLGDRRVAAAPEPAGADEPGVVCFSAQDWWYFNQAHSDFQLVTRIARHRPVLLVNSLGMRMPLPGKTAKPWARIGRKLSSVSKGLRHPLPDVPGFAVLTPLFIPVFRAGRARDLSNRFVAWQVARAARRLGLVTPDVIVTLPPALEVARLLPHRVLLANRSDRYGAFTEADQDWVGSLERQLLDEADAAVYASHAMLDAEEGRNRRPVFLDHGVDLDRFRPAEELREPADLASIARPRIGFFGAIDDYTVDLDLLGRLATELPEAELVLVGPTNCPMGALTRLRNVHWLGPRDAADIPAYGAGFDVAIMPWLDNDWIRHCNPIKLKEYLALGLPIVSTPFPELERYASLVRTARDADQFVALVRQSLLDGGPATPARRRASVEGDTWDRRAAELLELLDDSARDPQGRAATCAAS